MVVPAEPPRPRHAGEVAARVRFAREPCRTRRGLRHRVTAVGGLPHRLDRRPRELEDSIARDVSGDGRCAERADVDEGHADAVGREETANEVGLSTFRVERGEEKDGRHRAVVTILNKRGQTGVRPGSDRVVDRASWFDPRLTLV